MRPLHNTALAVLLSTFRPRHLQKETPCALNLNALRLPHSAKPPKGPVKLVLLETVERSPIYRPDKTRSTLTS